MLLRPLQGPTLTVKLLALQLFRPLPLPLLLLLPPPLLPPLQYKTHEQAVVDRLSAPAGCESTVPKWHVLQPLLLLLLT